MNLGRLFFTFWLFGIFGFKVNAQLMSKQGLLQFQSDFVQSEQQLDARLADNASPALLIDLNMQKAQLYMLYQREDLLKPLLIDIQQQVFAKDDTVFQSQWHLLRGIQHYLVGEYAQADDSFESSLQSLEQPNYQQEYAYQKNFILMYQAVNRIYLQQYDDALNTLTEVFKQAEQNQWPMIQARSLVFIGDVSYALKNYEQSLEYYQNAYNTYPQNALIYRAESQMFVAQMLNIVGDRSVAFAKLEQAMDTFTRQQDDTRLANAYLLMSYFYSKVPNKQKALEWIAKSVEIREKLGNPVDVANAYVHYSLQLGTDGQITLALEYAKKAVELAEPVDDLAGLWDAYANYAGLLNQAKDYQQAYHYMRLSERALLKKARLDITSQTATLNAKFNLNRQQLKNEFLDKQAKLLEERNSLLNTQLEMKQQQQKQQHWVLMVLTTALAFFLVMCGVIYRLYIKNKRLASLDPLTSLHNRRSILSLGEQAIISSERYEYALSVLMLDIDNFKAVNDKFGHETGDRVIQHIVNTCIDTVRKPDYLGRVGGEEFLIVLPHTDEQAALLLAQRLCKQVETSDKSSLGEVKKVTVSIGIATKDEHSKHPFNSVRGKDLSQLIREADLALYVAKAQGRNQVQAYHNELQLKGHKVDLDSTMPDMLRSPT